MKTVQTLPMAANDTSIVPTSMSIPTQADAYIHMIERVLRDPGIPMERLDKMLDVQDRVMRQRAQATFNVAFSQMQPEIPVIAERGQHGGTGKTYAKWDDVIEAIMPVLGKHGFSLRARSRQAEGKIYVTSILAHVDGHSEETTVELGADKSGQKNEVQAIGSSFSYGQRYGAKLLLSLSSRATGTPEDDDGDATGGSEIKYITQDQWTRMTTLATEVNMSDKELCRICEVEDLSRLSTENADKVIRKLIVTKQHRAKKQ